MEYDSKTFIKFTLFWKIDTAVERFFNEIIFTSYYIETAVFCACSKAKGYSLQHTKYFKYTTTQ